jgi:beta-phosphoglucomutase family hydrolase
MIKHLFKAVIFDLDGVITDTAAVHSAAWKTMFDEFLRSYSMENDLPFHEFTHEIDYLQYVDGKPRYQGVKSFLESRRINLPYGNPDDPPLRETICGLGNRKNALFNKAIADGQVKVFDTTVRFIRNLRDENIHVGVASSSKNCEAVLKAVGLLDLFETRVDGVVSAELGLAGKPQPDIFTTACDNLGAAYHESVIVEDAVSGVQAGRVGGFGLVLGVAREGNQAELRKHGADIVITDMEGFLIETIDAWFASKGQPTLNHLS